MARNYNTRDQQSMTNRGSSYYTYGNVAYELQPAPIPAYPSYDAEEQEQQRKAQERLDKVERREARMISAKMVAVVLVLFTGCLAFMGMNVIVANADVRNRQMRNQLSTVKEENAILAAELTEQIDMNYIKEVATSRLGMSEPQSYQVVYIDVPKQSYTVQYAADELAE